MQGKSCSLIIDSKAKIILVFEESFEQLHCCSQAAIQLYYEDKMMHESYYSAREYLLNLKNIVGRVLSDKAQLHESITQDIGLLLNEELQYKPGLYYINKGIISWWVGYEYCLSVAGKLGTWLYKDKNENIIFEATPIFPFTYHNYAKDPNYIPYKTWIKQYKPYFLTEPSLIELQKWPVLADSILNQIESNVQRFSN